MSNARRYETDRRPFLEVVNDGERNVLRIRQATEQGYIECQPDGVCDLAYPESVYRRSACSSTTARSSSDRPLY